MTIKRSIEIVESHNLKPADLAAMKEYSKFLESKNLPVIYNSRHLSQLVGIDLNYLYAVSNNTSEHYRQFKISKKGGGQRKITAPLPTLMLAQSWILNKILTKISVHKASKAYVKGTSIKINARLHRKPKNLFITDISDFFGSIKRHQIRTIFYSAGYSDALSVLLTNLCCLNGSLPQGAPTSGYLSNIVMFSFDENMLNYAQSNKLKYSRYADDIAISGEEISFDQIKTVVNNELEKINLKINIKKTKLLKRHNRQKVTGIVVNEKLNLQRDYLRRIRQEYYYVKKYGYQGHSNFIEETNSEYILERLIGKITHALHIKPYDKTLKGMKSDLLKLKEKNKPYLSD